MVKDVTIERIQSLGNSEGLGFALPPLLGPGAELSRELSARIVARIRHEGAPLVFAEFMQMALYEPGLGYYAAGATKLGVEGDFVTAPELSWLFADLLAGQCVEVLQGLGPQAGVLEFGAGSGRMAAGVLRELERRACLPAGYWILEVSPDLRLRQREILQAEVPHLLERVVWLESLEGFSLEGMVLANEVLDAMPVQRFYRTRSGVQALAVTVGNDGFEWARREADSDLTAAVREIETQRGAPFPEGYVSEINLNILPWVRAVSACLRRGVVLCVDYGYSRREYYLTDRSQGTLMCHYRHRAHGDPLVRVGAQDITAYVDFTALAEAAVQVGLDLAGYTTQAYFLLGCGLDGVLQRMQSEVSEREFLRLTQQAKTLLLPSEMGERFKVMGLLRGWEKPLRGFALMDFSNRL